MKRWGAALLLVFALVSGCGDDNDTPTGDLTMRNLVVGNLYADVQINGEDHHFYKFSITTGDTYRIALTNLGIDLDWSLYECIGETRQEYLVATRITDSAQAGLGNEIKDVILDPGTYMLWIFGRFEGDSHYDLSVFLP